jgi:cobalt-zinc-cadmium efflux system protein
MSHSHNHPDKTVGTSVAKDSHGHGDLSELRAMSRKRLLMVVLLTGGFMIAEVIAAWLTKSLAILADAGHMLGDVAAVALALIASWFATRPASQAKTYGYYRTEILASTLNALALLGMSVFITVEAYSRLRHPTEVPGLPMILVGITGGIVNLLAMKILRGVAEHSLNTKAAYLEVLADLLASVGVVIAGLTIHFTGWQYIDPIVSLIIAIALIPRTWTLLSQCVHVLMEGTPDHIAMNDLRTAILNVPGVVEVHDLHAWTITSGMDSLSGHVIIDQAARSDQVLTQITSVCEQQFGITHTTIQIEAVSCDRSKCP